MPKHPDRRLPTPVLAEDLADGWSLPRPRDLAFLRPHRPARPAEPQPPEQDTEEAA